MFMLKSTHQTEVRRLHLDLQKLKLDRDVWQHIATERAKIIKGYEQREANTKPKGAPSSKLDDTTIRRMLQLCHPDKHGNSPASVEITQLLISMRK